MKRVRLNHAVMGPLMGLIFAWVLFAAAASASGKEFVGWSNQRLMLLQTTVVATAAVGATLVIISGGIDLSVGSAIALGTMVVAKLLTWGVPPLLAALGGVVGGALIGTAIGAMVVGHLGRVAGVVVGLAIVLGTWHVLSPVLALMAGLLAAAVLVLTSDRLLGRVPLSPFIVTLGMWGALRGLAKGLGDNQPIYPDQTILTQLMQPAETGLGSILAPGAWLMLALAAVMAAALNTTRLGRHIFALGSNEQTARLCGVDVSYTKVMIYLMAGACAGLAAVFQFSFLYGQGDPTTAEGYELKVIAAVVIGGASLSGGEGSIVGTLLGALIMAVVDNGCTKLALDNWVQEVVTGVIIVAAVAMDRLRHRQRTGALS